MEEDKRPRYDIAILDAESMKVLAQADRQLWIVALAMLVGFQRKKHPGGIVFTIKTTEHDV